MTVTIEELVRRGFLASLTSTFTETQMNVEGIKKVQGDFEKQELESRVNSSEVNAKVVAETILRAEDRTAWLIFCVSVSHAEAMREEFREQGVVAEAITSRTSSSERERIFNDFKDGKIRALTNVGVATTGFDYPDIDVIVMARPTLSPGLYVQMSGRGMWVKSPGHHKDCLVLDFAGNIARHGAVTKIIPPRRTVKASRRTQELSEMFKLCPKCHGTVMKRSRECVHCGHIFAELYELSTSADIMGIESSGTVGTGFQRMKVASWYWKVAFRKKDNMPIVRADFYGEDKLQGPKQLFLYIMQEDSAREFIVATESGILHKMQQACPRKVFLPAPPDDSTCACNECNFMKLITMEKLYNCLRYEWPEIEVSKDVAEKAVRCINRMLDLSSK